MSFFSVTLIFETSEKPEFDLSLSARVRAENSAIALVLAKRVLKISYPNLDFGKNWCWFVEGKPLT